MQGRLQRLDANEKHVWMRPYTLRIASAAVDIQGLEP